MELTVNEDKVKELLTDIMINMIQQRKNIFYEMIVEAIEDVGLTNAISEGRKSKFVDEKRIMDILEG